MTFYISCYASNECEIQLSDLTISAYKDQELDFKPIDMNNYFNKYKTTWRNNLTNELNNNLNKTPTNFPLIENTYGSEEIMAMVEVLVSDRLTMGKNVDLFEKEFAQFVGAKYAIMVNSGSSANLLV